MDALAREYRERGVLAIAVNVLEAVDTAREYAAALDLEMPVGIYRSEMNPALWNDALPTVLVIDSEGRLRGRWDGYRPGIESEVRALVERLLHAGPDPQREVARVHTGAEAFAVRWWRDGLVGIGRAAIGRIDGTPGILAGGRRWLMLFDADGATARDWPGDPAASALRLAPGTGSIAGFRPGGTDLVLFDALGDEPRRLRLDAHVFDVAWWSDGPDTTRVLAATDRGLRAIDPASGASAIVDDRPASGVAATASVGGIAVLRLDGTLDRWRAPSEPVGAPVRVPVGSWRLIEARETPGIGVASSAVLDAAAGRFVANEAELVALLLAPARVVVTRPEDGRILFDASWPGASSLAAGDVDGDGIDELAVLGSSSLGIVAAKNVQELRTGDGATASNGQPSAN
jgi:hypothetical protein